MRRAEEPRAGNLAAGVRVTIVASDYHHEIHERLLAGACAAFAQAGGAPADLRIVVVDGVYDLPAPVAEAIRQGANAVVTLGCVVRGETRHDRHIVDAVFTTLAGLAAAHAVPVAVGILTVETLKQARQRAGGEKGDAGAFAMRAALRSAAALRDMRKDGDA